MTVLHTGGLIHYAYKNSPLEQMAYSLQEAFDENAVPQNLTGYIRRETDMIWQQVAALLPNSIESL
jgi:hypothetical protein